MTPVQVVGLGHPVINLGIAVDKLPESDHPANRLGMTWQVGGKIATAMSCITRLGFSSAIVGRAAADALPYIRRDLAIDGVDTSHLLADPTAQAYFTVSLAERATGGRSFLSAPAPVADLAPEELDEAFLKSARFLYLWGTGEADLTAAGWCREAGGQLVFDADTYHPGIEAILPFTHHFIASEYVYQALFGQSADYQENLRRLWERQGKGVVIVTLGARGLAGIDEQGSFFREEAFPVTVVDTTGAGDVFHGAYTAGRLAGMDAREAARFGSAVSAIKCTRLGCRAGLPTMENALSFLREGRFDEAELEERCRHWEKLPF
ncbi:MAG: carbohydrate kinase family protein [Angelakisella sp.]|nr:carbohydrate kinase family protein [Angelakisella sp.]